MTLPHSKDILDYPARFQWQSGAPCGGSSCCTDTVIQMIVEYYKEKTYSLAYIRKVAQAKTSFNESPCTGINYIEVLNALEALGITHYKVGWNVNAKDIINKVAIGPTLVGVYYGNYPKNRSGRCGTTNKAEHGGKTDCPFRGAHAVLALKRVNHLTTSGKYAHTDMLVRDPNHNSASRPEKPMYDRITLSQLDKSMKALVPYTPFKNTYCIYPTKRK